MDNCIVIPDLSLTFRRAEISVYIEKCTFVIMHTYIDLYVDAYIKVNLIFYIQN